MFTKIFHVSQGINSLFCTELDDCSLLEMLRERASLINPAANHVESDTHYEKTACVTTSILCMYAEKTLMGPYDIVSFHANIAPQFVIIED